MFDKYFFRFLSSNVSININLRWSIDTWCTQLYTNLFVEIDSRKFPRDDSEILEF